MPRAHTRLVMSIECNFARVLKKKTQSSVWENLIKSLQLNVMLLLIFPTSPLSPKHFTISIRELRLFQVNGGNGAILNCSRQRRDWSGKVLYRYTLDLNHDNWPSRLLNSCQKWIYIPIEILPPSTIFHSTFLKIAAVFWTYFPRWSGFVIWAEWDTAQGIRVQD